ncbi:VCBS repeat-containing protein [Actinoplanes sp. NPDC051861]|uniref:FG-GAP repeat domain-containing protein n=1 Tax=Actinoplanes sp. NPDC051861 TaxID=3155170 RepID=UPI003419713D
MHATVRWATAVAVGVASVTVVAATPAAAQRFVMRDFGIEQGWDSTRHVRAVADVTGDGRADVVGFFFTGVHTAVAVGDGTFAAPRQVSNDFAITTGWRVDGHDRVVTDITGDGRADIVGIRENGVFTAVSTGGGAFGPITQVSTAFTTSACAIRKVADADGDGRSDLFCIRDRRIEVALARGDGRFGTPIFVSGVFPVRDGLGFTTEFTIADFSGDGRADILGAISSTQGSPNTFLTLRASGAGLYDAEEFGGGIWPRSGGTVAPSLVTDVSGDGFADLIFFNDFTYVARGRGDGTFANYVLALSDLGFVNKWFDARHLRMAADLNGDGRSDLVGFGDPGVFTLLGRTNGGFETMRLASPEFGASRQWKVVENPRFLADITGDGRPDIVGFGDQGIWTGVNQNGVFV